MVRGALASVSAGETAYLLATPEAPVGEIVAVVRRIANEKALAISVDIAELGVFVHPRQRAR